LKRGARPANPFNLYDTTTLRDGHKNAKGWQFSTAEKVIKSPTALDTLGVDYIEAAGRAANPTRIVRFFRRRTYLRGHE